MKRLEDDYAIYEIDNSIHQGFGPSGVGAPGQFLDQPVALAAESGYRRVGRNGNIWPGYDEVGRDWGIYRRDLSRGSPHSSR